MKLPFRPPSFAFYQRLNPRERVLLAMVGGSLLIIINLFLLSVLIRSWRDLSLEYTAKSQELTREQIFADQKTSLWEPREAWLKTAQPPLANRNLAGSQLLDTIKNLAQGSQVIISSQSIATAAPGGPSTNAGGAAAEYQPITVRVDTQSDWQGIVKFMAAVQKPDAFLVFDTANLHTEQSDPAKMRGEFVISKWFAPAGK